MLYIHLYKPIMANIVSTSLTRLRRHDASRPLHARWGDVAITAPTEGSWCQYDNPHKSAQRRDGYGPGYVPDGYRAPREEGHEEEKDGNEDEKKRNASPISMGNLNSRRLSMCLSRTKTPEREQERPQRQPQHPRVYNEFAYKPIKHDYSTEVAEVAGDHRASRFRYIPASPRYFEELEMIGSRSQSVSSDDSRGRRGYDCVEEEGEEQEQDRPTSRAPGSRGSIASLPKRVLSSSSVMRQRNRNGLSNEKKRYSSRRMTTVMVPDAKDIYG